MADIVSNRLKMNDIEIADEAPLSEALFEKFGANINYLIDERDQQETRIEDLEAQSLQSFSANFSSSITTGAGETTVATLSNVVVGNGGVNFYFGPRTTSSSFSTASFAGINGITGDQIRVRFKRGGTTLINELLTSPGGVGASVTVDLRGFVYKDSPSAGTYTYTFTVEAITSAALTTAAFNALTVSIG